MLIGGMLFVSSPTMEVPGSCQANAGDSHDSM